MNVPHGAQRERQDNKGWVAEWSKAAVLKTAVRETVPGVRIPPRPLGFPVPDSAIAFVLKKGRRESTRSQIWGAYEGMRGHCLVAVQ